MSASSVQLTLFRASAGACVLYRVGSSQSCATRRAAAGDRPCPHLLHMSPAPGARTSRLLCLLPLPSAPPLGLLLGLLLWLLVAGLLPWLVLFACSLWRCVLLGAWLGAAALLTWPAGVGDACCTAPATVAIATGAAKVGLVPCDLLAVACFCCCCCCCCCCCGEYLGLSAGLCCACICGPGGAMGDLPCAVLAT